jgi:cGMP-dependent protein kinase
LNLRDLQVVKLLGKGTFGTVFLVTDVLKHRFFALKSVSKAKIEAYKIQDNLLLERKILLSLDHVMALKLVKTFKDSKRIYFLTEYVKGQDLFDVIRILNLLTEQSARFYISCIVLVLDYLHERDIIFRDLKPENVLIDMEGYPKLIDFGAGKFISGRTYTIIGTPHYMAPEIILGHGYSHSADLWSLGIMLYEFLYGGVPFGERQDDPSAIYEAILSRKLVYPANIQVSQECKDLIEQLLNRKPISRNAGSSEALRAHGWFRRNDWDKLLGKEISPPFIPNLPDPNIDDFAVIGQNQSIEEVIDREEERNLSPREFSHSLDSNWDEEF